MIILHVKITVKASFPINKNKTYPCMKQTQFPLILSWACTIHNVHGVSLDEGIVSFNLQRQKTFNQGQMYVALSRIRHQKYVSYRVLYRAAIKVNALAEK